MDLFRDLLTTDVGLMSLFVILFMVGMGFYLWRMISRKMRESERRSGGA